MRILEWFRPGVGIKRWITVGLVGLASSAIGMTYFFTAVWWNDLLAVLSAFMILSGIALMVFSIKFIISRVLDIVGTRNTKFEIDRESLGELLYERRILIRGPKIVAIGGGTGLSTLLRGLKKFSSNITAVVTVADDGGGSGVLREELGILPPGDIRNCIMALANTEPIMQDLLQYRFSDGRLKGQSFGNLFLTAMDGISENFETAVEKMSKVLAITGKVSPVTNYTVDLEAEMDNGVTVRGESKIADYIEQNNVKIKNIKLTPDDAKPLEQVLDAIAEADIILFGPGSLYTSVLPNLLVDGVVRAIKKSKALKAYICNVMTQPSETKNFSANEHISEIEKYAYKGIFDYCFINNRPIPSELIEKYRLENADVVYYSKKEIESKGIKVIEGDYISFEGGKIRHNAEAVSESIIKLVAEKVLKKDKKRELDYYYAKEQTK